MRRGKVICGEFPYRAAVHEPPPSSWSRKDVVRLSWLVLVAGMVAGFGLNWFAELTLPIVKREARTRTAVCSGDPRTTPLCERYQKEDGNWCYHEERP